jgi:hypothetical protein
VRFYESIDCGENAHLALEAIQHGNWYDLPLTGMLGRKVLIE